ncbi:lipoyltransferase [Novosphingobium sp. YJ-S2-02]|uniref:Lipoyltransferase n=1 Tax=Novosphingobium aureum TaxID=2792964 RepID=A0A931MMI6_9SPHN|nr:lipoyltransferase [Novosphingobium aureum]MBH0114191.1 lipoyltransferase [Novosphingobium aureum]
MRFDSNRAWTGGIAKVMANRDVLIALAGVFFFLPTLLSGVFLADVQAVMMANLENEAVLKQVMAEHMGSILALSLGSALVQGLGYLAVMALLSGQGRPTVGEAIRTAFRSLPTLIAASLIYFAAFVLIMLVAGLFVGALGGLTGLAGVMSGVMVLFVMVGLFYTSIRLSLLTATIVRDGIANPLHALLRSWQLTRGNALRLLGFFLLLFAGYLALSFVLSLFVVTPVALLAGPGDATTLAGGIVSGLIGAVASVIMTALLVEAHEQLSGGMPGSEAKTFE